MKPRRWIAVLFIFICISFLALYFGIKYLEKSKKIEQILIKNLSEASGGSVFVEKVKVGFFSVYLNNVKATVSVANFSANIKDIKVSFSLKKLLLTKGNFEKSIRKVILILPTIDIIFLNKNKIQSQPIINLPANFSINRLFTGFPVKNILIRKGSIAVVTESGRLILGKDFSGQISDKLELISAELKGCFASGKKNLFISAELYKKEQRHRISLRLNNAQIKNPLEIGSIKFNGGKIDGVTEFLLSDTFDLNKIESNGWLKIYDAECFINKLNFPVKKINLSATLSNTQAKIDSMRCEIYDAQLIGKGVWDLIQNDSINNNILIRTAPAKIENINIIPSPAKKYLKGTLWTQVKLWKKNIKEGLFFTCDFGGLNFLDLPISSGTINGSLDNKEIMLDTIKLTGPTYKLLSLGNIKYKEKPVTYNLLYRANIDSLPYVNDLNAKISLNGKICGKDANYSGDAIASFFGVKYQNINLGNFELLLKISNGKTILFETAKKTSDYLYLSGTLDSLSSKEPLISLKARLKTNFAKDIFKQKYQFLLDSCNTDLVLNGKISNFNAIANVKIASLRNAYIPSLNGSFDVFLEKKSDEKRLYCSIAQKNLLINDTIIPFSAKMYLYGDSILIDSLFVLDGIKASGVAHTGKRTSCDFVVKYREVPIDVLTSVLIGKKQPLASGFLNGKTTVSVFSNSLKTDSDLHIRKAELPPFSNLETDFIIKTQDTFLTVLPMVVRKNGSPFIIIDTITNKNGLKFSGTILEAELSSIIEKILPDEFIKYKDNINGSFNGKFASLTDEIAGRVNLSSNRLSMDNWSLEKVNASFTINKKGIRIDSVTANDSLRASFCLNGFIPWNVVLGEENEKDTLNINFLLYGDIIEMLEKNFGIPFALPIAGHGMGKIEVSFLGTYDGYQINKANFSIPKGLLKAKPWIPYDIKDFSLNICLDSQENLKNSNLLDNEKPIAKLKTVIKGTINKRPVEIKSTHQIPRGFEPIIVGPFDFGALLVFTPHQGIDAHVPGLQAIGSIADVEFAGKSPFSDFAISGPIDRLCISGTIILRSCEITFPPLDNVETKVKVDPFPYINWNVDLRVGNRNVVYYYDTGRKRNLMRLVEAYIDPISTLAMRGRVLDNNFRLYNSIRSSKGWIFLGRNFDRNFTVGLDFVPEPLPDKSGYNNLPIIWGNAEAVSDTSRFDRIKITLLVRDSVTGAYSERGRFHDIHFRIGSNIEKMPGEAEKQFVTDESRKYGSLEGAGGFVTAVGEQYLHRVFLQNIERRIAKTLGLDVITIETSIASNYFNKLLSRQFEWNKLDYLTFANVGVTLGRYVLYDKVFIKMRTELVPKDTLLRPEYNFGFEFQPVQYLMMDVNYGFYMGENSWQANPKIYLYLQLPITNLRKFFDF